MAKCRRCDAEYAPQLQIDDLIEVERELGYRYETSTPRTDHYQRICPACRRSMLGIAQGEIWGRRGSPAEHAPMPMRID